MRKVFPPTYFTVFLVLSIILHFIFPVFQVINFPFSLLGLALILFGIVMNVWADSLFKKRGTTVLPDELPTRLVDYGPFRISRNPMYLGLASLLLGVAVLLGSLVTFAFPVLFTVIMEIKFITMEEASLKKVFGKGFEKYKKRTRKWI